MEDIANIINLVVRAVKKLRRFERMTDVSSHSITLVHNDYLFRSMKKRAMENLQNIVDQYAEIGTFT